MSQSGISVPPAGVTLTVYFFVRDLFRFGRRARKRRAKVVLERWIADPGTPRLAIDCGANVGSVSARLLEAGYEVHAFEPDPAAFSVLRERLGDNSSIQLIQAAVSDRTGRSLLRRHRDFGDGKLIRTESSSIVSRPGVNDDHAVDVEMVDLCDYIRNVSSRIGLLKMDIEGAEIAIIHRMLDEGLVEGVAYISIETHERFGPLTAWRTAQARARVKQAGFDHISFDHP